MSESSYQTSSYETTSSDNAAGSSTKQIDAEENSKPPAAHSKQSPHSLTIRNATQKASPPRQLSPRKRARRTGSLTQGFRGSLHAYRDILNEAIEEAAGRSEPGLAALPPSQIEASFWTSAEKNTFFCKLAICETGDLRALSTAVCTKSQAECQTYLDLLREGASQVDESGSRKYDSLSAAMPIAVEVGTQTEAACNVAAMTLSYRVEEHDEKTERLKHGDVWLIDQNFATTVEQKVEGAESFNKDAVYPGQEDEGAAEIDSREPADPDLLELPPSTRLLKPAAFLHLSETLFMNGLLGTESNWREVAAQDDSPATPAMFRTAFDDFYNLTVSLTRRLVQASIFQAMTRLRAADASRTDWQPEADVKGVDVRTALDVLNMTLDAKAYWPTVARRCGVNVYSDSKKYHQDGRAGTKVGVLLTYEEVESELGLSKPVYHNGLDDVSQTQDPESESRSDSSTSDEDAFTIESSTDDSASSSDRLRDDPKQSRGLNKRLKRALSPQSYERAEDQYLESLDHKTSVAEEQHLREVLGLLPMSDTEAVATENQAPFKSRNIASSQTNWRADLEYEAEWERFPDAVTNDEFERVSLEGSRRKRKRCARQMRHSRRKGQKNDVVDPGPAFGGEERDKASDADSDETDSVSD